MVRRRAYTLLGESSAADDAVQEVFVRVLKNIDLFRQESSPLTWLYRITTNVCVDHLRRGARTRLSANGELTTHLLEVNPSVEGQLVDRDMLARGLGRCSAEELQILLHRHCDGMSQDEIAQAMDLSRKTVWNKLERIRRRFEKMSKT